MHANARTRDEVDQAAYDRIVDAFAEEFAINTLLGNRFGVEPKGVRTIADAFGLDVETVARDYRERAEIAFPEQLAEARAHAVEDAQARVDAGSPAHVNSRVENPDEQAAYDRIVRTFAEEYASNFVYGNRFGLEPAGASTVAAAYGLTRNAVVRDYSAWAEFIHADAMKEARVHEAQRRQKIAIAA